MKLMALSRRRCCVFRPGPSQRKDAVEPFSFSSKIPEQGNIRDQSKIEADGTHREVDRDAADIPEQRRTKMGISDGI